MVIRFETEEYEIIADAIVKRIKEEKKFSSTIGERDALWVEIEDILFPVSYEIFDSNDVEVSNIGCGRASLEYDNRPIEDLIIEKLHNH